MNPCDGTCGHFGRIEYVHKVCLRCWMSFLGCPVCRPIYCPDCRNIELVIKVDLPYYKAKKKSLARIKAWKDRQKQLEA